MVWLASWAPTCADHRHDCSDEPLGWAKKQRDRTLRAMQPTLHDNHALFEQREMSDRSLLRMRPGPTGNSTKMTLTNPTIG